jgi:hypothetical protein
LLLDPAQYDGLPLSVNVFTGVNKTTHDWNDTNLYHDLRQIIKDKGRF